jgi:hypothetical protein
MIHKHEFFPCDIFGVTILVHLKHIATTLKLIYSQYFSLHPYDALRAIYTSKNKHLFKENL